MVIDEGVQALTPKTLAADKRRELLLAFLYKFADTPNVQQRIIGRYWDRATAEQRTAYLKLLDEYVVLSYEDDFKNFGADEHIDIQNAEAIDGKIVVHSLDIDPLDPPPSRVDWVLVTGPKGFKVTDALVDGVSLIATLSEDFQSILRNNGGKIDGLLDVMRAKIAQLKTTKN
ncbi:MAG TPA: ABC transporter substrate-binding protein [Candidatus Cybelea sp.]|nr:ABC transporter substrate-binding protein [Candidatus Cybelea sp.]